MKFYDREEQLANLREMKARSYKNHSMLTVVTGRRRIGKTTLIDKAMEGEPYIYLFVAKKNESVLCKEFSTQIKQSLDIFIPESVSSFRDIFAILMQTGTTKPFTLVIDEFQNFHEVNPSVFSDIQNWWDQYRLKSHVNFIVSGSVYSLMTKLFKNNKEPLYGRDDLTIKLQPFSPSVMVEIMNDYNPGYSNDDLLALYTYTGAVPKYVELLVDAEALTKDAMIKFICREDSPFIEEGRKLLIQEFGRKYATYFSILQAISEGYNTQSAITDYLGEKSLGGHLRNLEETYGLVEKKRPLWAGRKTQTVRYELSDVFLRFWFRYIEKNQQLIEIGQFPLLQKIMQEDYETYSGDTLERYFRAIMIESKKYSTIGNWWDSRGFIDDKGNHQQCEIDAIAIDAEDRTAYIYEIKRNPAKYKKGLLEAKAAHMKKKEKRLNRYKLVLGCLSLDDVRV